MSEEETEVVGEEKVEVDDLLKLSELIFLVQQNNENKMEYVKEIGTIVEKNDMFPYYDQYLKHQLPEIRFDNETLERMRETNEKKIKELDLKIQDSFDNLGESEVREAYLERSNYYKQIGDKDNAKKSFKVTLEKTIDLGQKINIAFMIIRVGFGFNDHECMKNNIIHAKKMIDRGGDWERRNRLKIYEGAFLMKTRKFEESCKLLMEAISTFSSGEFMSFRKFIFYTIVMAIFSVPRPVLKEKIIDSSDILTVIDKIPNVSIFIKSFYQCKYRTFFESLIEVEDMMSEDKLLFDHVAFYSREMRIRAYKQFLKSYLSVTMESMASSFGISLEFLDSELSKFIEGGRLSCKIDRVNRVINTTRPKKSNARYQNLMKKGDILLGRLQKLSRVVDL